jgi:hypothetical protein
MENKIEKIWLAAIRLDNGLIFTGNNHGYCILTSYRINHLEEKITQRKQGFVTDQFRFVDRAEAAKIAFAAGQIDKEVAVLISEDLNKKCL